MLKKVTDYLHIVVELHSRYFILLRSVSYIWRSHCSWNAHLDIQIQSVYSFPKLVLRLMISNNCLVIKIQKEHYNVWLSDNMNKQKSIFSIAIQEFIHWTSQTDIFTLWKIKSSFLGFFLVKQQSSVTLNHVLRETFKIWWKQKKHVRQTITVISLVRVCVCVPLTPFVQSHDSVVAELDQGVFIRIR